MLAADAFALANLEKLDTTQTAWPRPGQFYAGFQLGRELGQGSFARVYLAREPALGDRPVVVKVTRHGCAEAETLGRLQHPHVVPVFSVRRNADTGLTAICMPLRARRSTTHSR